MTDMLREGPVHGDDFAAYQGGADRLRAWVAGAVSAQVGDPDYEQAFELADAITRAS